MNHTTRRTKFILVAVFCLDLFFVSGCFSPNARRAEFGCAAAIAMLKNGVPSYWDVEIERQTNAMAPQLLFKLPDGQIVEWTSLTCDDLKQAGFKETHRDYQTQYSHVFEGNDASFFFVGDMLVNMHSLGSTVGIGRNNTKQFYTVPMTQENLELLFGKPDKMSNFNFW